MAGLSLTVLGCDGSYAAPGGACSGYLLSSGGTHVWMDCGPGTLANLQQHIALSDISAIVISHAHPDHWVELPVVHNALHYYVGRHGVPLFTTLETLRRCESVRGAHIGQTFNIHPITGGSSFTVEGMSFRASITDHPVETLALRVECAGRVLSYSADTGPGWSIAQLGASDVALCEATLRADQAGTAPHLSTTEAGRSARDAGASRLIITHLPPFADAGASRSEASDAFGSAVEVATTHARFEI